MTSPAHPDIAVASKLKARVETLDAVAATLVVRTDILARNADSFLGQFTISVNDCKLLEGRIIAAVAGAGSA